MTFTQLGILVIVVATLAVLFLFLRGALFAGDEAIDEEECRSSIRAHSRLVTLSGEASAPPITCEPRAVTIDNRDEERAKRLIAEELVFCWDRWQQGDVELFKEEGAYCNPCSIITFTDAARPVSGLERFFEEEMGPGKPSYREYLFPQRTTGFTGLAPFNPAPPIDPSATYAVVFYYDKNHSAKSYGALLKEDPSRATRLGQDLLDGAKSGAGQLLVVEGVLLGAATVCTAASLGLCALPSLAVIGLATGVAVIGGGFIGAWQAYDNGVQYPEWFSVVLLIRQESDGYRALGCSHVEQAGPPRAADGAENI